MVRSTTIFRVSDALPLAASVDDENVSYVRRTLDCSLRIDRKSVDGIQATIKARLSSIKCQLRTSLLHRIRSIHPSVCHEPMACLLSWLTVTPTNNSYLIVDKVIYMCICDSSYPRKLAFSYLDELSKEFQNSYGDKIESVSRPYAFMGFGKSLSDSHQW